MTFFLFCHKDIGFYPNTILIKSETELEILSQRYGKVIRNELGENEEFLIIKYSHIAHDYSLYLYLDSDSEPAPFDPNDIISPWEDYSYGERLNFFNQLVEGVIPSNLTEKYNIRGYLVVSR